MGRARFAAGLTGSGLTIGMGLDRITAMGVALDQGWILP